MLLGRNLARFRCPSRSGLSIAAKMLHHVVKQHLRCVVSPRDRYAYLDHCCVLGAQKRFSLVVNDPIDIGKRIFKLTSELNLQWAFHRPGPPS